VEERNSQFSTNFLFNAKELDNETGLYYYGARYLDPTGAMWLSVDPMLGAVLPDGTVVIIKPQTPSSVKSALKREKLMQDNGFKTEIKYYDPKDPKYLPGSPTYIGPKH
jgi:hypothetical protein